MVVVAAAVLTRPATTADSQATYLVTARSHARTVVTEMLETEKGLAPVIIVDGKDTCLESAQTDVLVALVVVVLAVVAVEEEAVEVESASSKQLWLLIASNVETSKILISIRYPS